MKKGVGFGVGSGSIIQRYGSGDPDPHQNVMDPRHCLKLPSQGAALSWKERREFVPVEYGELEHVEDHDESHAARLATCTNNHVKPLRGICAN